MININYVGGLGNRMFMYAAANVLSKKHKLQVNNVFEEYPTQPNLDITHRKYDSDLIVDNNNFMSVYDSDDIKSNLILNDFFQTREIVTRFENEFKNCFRQELDPIDGTIIHYRLGDLLNLYNQEAVTKLSYFKKCIDLLEDKKNIYLTTDSPDHENIKYLIEKYNIKLIDLKRSETIQFASRFKSKILSTGTFSWWIGFLGNQHSNVYCPILNEYYAWLGDIYIFNDWNYISYK